MTAPELVQPKRCNYCPALILWLTTGRDHRMPVDAEPHERGNVAIDPDTGRCDVLGRTQAAGARAAGRPLHRHHKLTCPHADRWSKPRRP